jgi:malate dehydrogenase (quinone)
MLIMSIPNRIEVLDIALVGSGVMSANLGALLKSMDSKLKIELYEVTDELSYETLGFVN